MRTQLGEVCKPRSSLIDPTSVKFRDLPHIAPDSIEKGTGRLLAYRSAAEDGVTSGKYWFSSGDILYSKIRPNLNKVARARFEGLCSADMYALEVASERASPEFLTYVLRGQPFLAYAATVSNRANIPKINRDQLMRFEFELPPLAEQRRIAAILDHADALRAKRRQVLAHLDALASALFAEFFSNVRELDTFRRTGVDFIAGKNVVGDGFDSHPTNKVIKVSAISTGRFVQDESKPMPSSYSPPESHRLRKGDVLFGRASGSLDLLGETAVVDHEVDDLFLPDKVWRLSVDPSSPLSPKYVLGLLRSPRTRAFIRHNASGAAGVRNISKSKLLEMTVPVPSREVQSRYASLVESVEAQRAVVQQQSDLDNELFTALQSRAFRGEL